MRTSCVPRPISFVLVALVAAAVALVVAPSTASAPRAPPPVPIHPNDPAPPPAWISAGRAQKWLAYFDYCWPAGAARYCAGFDGIPRETPRLVVRQRQMVRFHLGFRPTSVVLEFPGYFWPNGGLTRLWELRPARTTAWRVRDDDGGLAILKARLPGEGCTHKICHAFYLLRLVIKPAKACVKPR